MLVIEDIIKNNRMEFKASKSARSKSTTLSDFFNGTSMARVLDIFLDNKDKPINLTDLVRLGISRKSIQNNIPILVQQGVLEEDVITPFKFYTMKSNNEQVKHLDKFRQLIS